MLALLPAGNQLNNREWATLVWLGIIVVWVLSQRSFRSSLGDILRVARSWKIWLSLLALFAWTVGLAALAHRMHLWSPDLIKDTVIWICGPAIVSLYRATQVGEKPQFFRRSFVAALRYSVLVEVFVNLFVFSLVAELFLVPFVTLLLMVSVVAGMKQETMVVKRAIDTATALIGFWLLFYVTAHVVSSWQHIDKLHDLRELALPVWLSIGVLPFVYLLSLVSNYELAFMRIGFGVNDKRARRRANLALLTTLHLRTYAVANFGGSALVELAAASSFHDARRTVKKFMRQGSA